MKDMGCGLSFRPKYDILKRSVIIHMMPSLGFGTELKSFKGTKHLHGSFYEVYNGVLLHLSSPLSLKTLGSEEISSGRDRAGLSYH